MAKYMFDCRKCSKTKEIHNGKLKGVYCTVSLERAADGAVAGSFFEWDWKDGSGKNAICRCPFYEVKEVSL